MQARTEASNERKVIAVIQGGQAVSSDPEAILTTVLGSCVATCLWDETAEVGGMNHFLLPENTGNETDSSLFGAHAMELLINELLKRGARKSMLQAKLFGGGRIVPGLSDIGAKNCAFAVNFLECEQIPCVTSSLGGDRARRVRFWPATGKAQQLILSSTVEAVAPKPKPAEVDAGDVSFF